MTYRKRNWFLRRIVLGLAFAAVMTPAAHAQVVDDGGGGSSYESSGYSAGSAEPTIAELLYDVDRAMAALEGETYGALRLEQKADLFAPQPGIESGTEIGWREIGTGAGIGLALVACCVAFLIAASRRNQNIARA